MEIKVNNSKSVQVQFILCKLNSPELNSSRLSETDSIKDYDKNILGNVSSSQAHLEKAHYKRKKKQPMRNEDDYTGYLDNRF